MKERREKIRKYMECHGEVTIGELTKEFSRWSEMTLRRDLDFLAKEGVVILTRGGARLMPSSYGVSEDVYAEREKIGSVGKQQIAEKAVKLVEPGMGIFIDSGTTGMAFARNLPDYNMVVITSAPNIALEIAVKKNNPSIIMLGGTVTRRSMAVSDSNIGEQLANLNIDTAFLATSGYDETAGFSVGSQSDAILERAVIARARRVVMLMDSSKIGSMMPFTFARPEDLSVIVTDRSIPQGIKDKLKKQTSVL